MEELSFRKSSSSSTKRDPLCILDCRPTAMEIEAGIKCRGHHLPFFDDYCNFKLESASINDTEALASHVTDRRRSVSQSAAPKESYRSTESLLPPPDFEAAIYPRGWAIGKKRKLVNVDVVESMRRIAIQEMNRKDREINGLNEQLEEDCRTMEQLQVQLQQERAKRLEAERQNAWLHDQICTLMDMMNDPGHTSDATLPD
eukprot:Gb_32045 [translate_table: standard]